MKSFIKTMAVIFLIASTVSINASSCCPDPSSAECKPAITNANIMLIPEDKKFSNNFINKLFSRGKKEIYSGKNLETIGMPCGGIGCGQMYLCGDGTLADWQIFGFAVSRWVENTSSTFAYQKMRKPVEQGFAVTIKTGDSKTIVKKLCVAASERSEIVDSREKSTGSLHSPATTFTGFKNVEFNGEYPIATINYNEKNCPVKVSSEVFSPFIPLDAKESAFPATIFNITVENCSDKNVEASILGWLENMVCMNTRNSYDIKGDTVFKNFKNSEIMTQTVTPVKKRIIADRISIIFEDFEGTNWNKWIVEGDAPGAKPTTKTQLAGQSTVSGFSGNGYVNTMHNGDKSTGTLTSPEFTIKEDYINYLIGGGGGENVYAALIIEGNEVEKAKGINSEELRWQNWDVKKYKGKKAKYKIVDKANLGWGHINVDNIEFSNYPRFGAGSLITNTVDYGNISLACLNDYSKTLSSYPDNQKEKYITKDSEYILKGKKCGLLSTKYVNLKPGQKKTFSFILSWYFPNKENGWLYAKRFSSSADVTKHLIKNFDNLTDNTRKWRDIYYDSSLPYWLLDRLHSTVSYLATGTAYWRKNGRFYAFEGCTCCRGTCTHVWGYAQTHARLFPSLGRNIRERQDFTPIKDGGGFFPETGLVAFRGGEDGLWLAVDGQCDTVLNAYRENLMSANKDFLKRNWKKIKITLEYLIEQDALGLEGGKDSPDLAHVDNKLPKPEPKSTNAPNGIIEGTQHNTYDLNYQGPNTLIGALYLAALRAGEEMATEMNDKKFAEECRDLFESGSSWTISNLWNGEYFVQKVDLKKYPEHQYKDGCLSDQLFGQFWAHQIGLGYIYPTNYIRSAMNAVWKYNFAPDVGPYNKKFKPFRWFIKKEGQGGLFTCTWPQGDYIASGTSYKNEIWSGIEYQVAAGLIAEGMVTQGLAICYAVHDRYQPGFLNPYNEIECGDHYARAMASWGVYLALAGFQYDGPNGYVGFNPVTTPGNFKAAFTFAEGWATFEQKRERGIQANEIIMAKGNLKIKTLSLGIPENLKSKNVIIKINGKEHEAKVNFRNGKVKITFPKKIMLTEKDKIEVRIGG